MVSGAAMRLVSPGHPEGGAMSMTCPGSFRTATMAMAFGAVAALASDPFTLDAPATAVPRFSPDNARWRIECRGFDGNRDLTVDAECADGSWRVTGTSLSGQRPPAATASVSRAVVVDGRVSGEITVNILTTNASVEMTGTLSIPDPSAWWPVLDYDPFGEGYGWWNVMAVSQPVTATLAGEWKAGNRSGAIAGSLTPRREPGRFDMGVASREGLELRFDMGRKRVNWNHARVAVYTFPKPLDLDEYAGLRVAVATTEPRRDVEVSVWLREEDGSWYYAKAAVPLAAAETEAFVDFRDFVEAEWVAPGSHVDEDYVFDRSAVSHFGVGLVNPLGIGRVSFTLRGVRAEGVRPPAPTVTASVSGRMLAVNGAEFVPPGLFGGYAPDLPQRYRPGCQRNLRFGPGGGPSIPDANHAAFSPGTFANWNALAERLVHSKGDDPAAGIRAIADPRDVQAIAAAVSRKDAGAGRQALARVFNAVLTNTQWAATVLSSLEVPREVRDPLQDAGATGLAKLVAQRRLLECVLSGQFFPFRKASEAFYIDCMGDRFCPATRILSANWKEQITGLGRDYAQTAKRMGYNAVMEWWNEPYLDWARGAGARNYRTNYYDLGKAEDGGPVTIKATGEVFDLLRWKKTHEGWRVYDPTQFGYFSGRANGRIYDDMIAVLGPALKGVGGTTAEPGCTCGRRHDRGGVTLMAGWGFRWHEDHWAAWDLLYRPTIDRGIEWIDAICEHHYQGDTTAMTGSYEMLEAYAVTRHKKWLHIYNTECNDLLDAPSRGMVDTPEKARAATNYRRMTYNMRDILHMILHVPDKAAGRTVIHYDQTLAGMDVAYGLMADLRGRLVETATTDPDVWCVASMDGTDSRAMPEDGRTNLVVFLFNDHREPAKVKIVLAPPSGMTIGTGTVEEVTVDAAWRVGVRASSVSSTDNAFESEVELPGRRAWKVTFPLTGVAPGGADVRRRQAFAPDVLREVTPERTFETTIAIGGARTKAIGRAWLRMVVEDVAPGEGWVDVGGARIDLPASRTADNCNRIVELPLASVPPEGNLPVRFGVAEGPHAGYRVDMVSVVLEERR